ncbi:MAG: hypothetical protein QXV44_02840 [Candidatus Anstonellaceae archaeon]
MKKLFLAVFLFSLSFALQLNISVFDPKGIKLVGTNVSIFSGNSLVDFKKTTLYQKFGEDSKALAQFDLEEGVYFILLERDYYQPNIYLIELNSPTSLEFILPQQTPTYSLYGKLKNYFPIEKKELALIDKRGLKSATSKIYRGGYFIFYSLYPQTEYRIMLEDKNTKLYSQYFSYNSPGVYYLELDLSSPSDFENRSIIFNSPDLVFVGQPIKLILKYGDIPLKNKSIFVQLPSSLNTTILTDEFGVAIINAAEEGQYTFIYENYTTSTFAKSLKQPKEIEEITITNHSLENLENQSDVQNASEKEQQPTNTSSSSQLAIKSQPNIGYELVVLAFITIFFGLLFLVFIYFLFLKKPK